MKFAKIDLKSKDGEEGAVLWTDTVLLAATVHGTLVVSTNRTYGADPRINAFLLDPEKVEIALLESGDVEVHKDFIGTALKLALAQRNMEVFTEGIGKLFQELKAAA